jgi:hypothetical protein
MKKWIWMIVAIICSFQLSGCLGETSISASSIDGTYVYNIDAMYTISISGERCGIAYGMNFFSGECSREADGTWKLTETSDYSKIDLRVKSDGDQLLVSGDIILINALGQVDRASISLENAIFEKSTPVDSATIAGTSWQPASTNDINFFMTTLISNYNLSFDTQGMTGAMGDSMFGATTPFSYTVENDEIHLSFEDASKNGVGTIEDGALVVIFGEVTIYYRQSLAGYH